MGHHLKKSDHQSQTTVQSILTIQVHLRPLACNNFTQCASTERGVNKEAV